MHVLYPCNRACTGLAYQVYSEVCKAMVKVHTADRKAVNITFRRKRVAMIITVP